MSDIKEFIKGQEDCKKGVPHKKGGSEAYTRGYATQYELEQVMSHG